MRGNIEDTLGYSRNQNYSRSTIMLGSHNSAGLFGFIFSCSSYFAFVFFLCFSPLDQLGWWHMGREFAPDWFENKTFQQLKLHFLVTRAYILNFFYFPTRAANFITQNHIRYASIGMKLAAYDIDTTSIKLNFMLWITIFCLQRYQL